ALLDNLRFYQATVYDPISFLEDLIKDAENAKLPHVVAQAAKLLRTARTQFSPPEREIEIIPHGDFAHDDGDDDGHAEGEEDGDDIFEGIFPKGPRPAPEDLKVMLEIIMQMKVLNPKEMKAFRKEMVRNAGMDNSTFDMLANLAQTATAEELATVFTGLTRPRGPFGIDFPPAPPPLPRGARRASPHPDQLDLF
ncbi:MAG TPA: hypothetical protein VK956_19925, partial [Verrucomicrobium sp.]|nr:hypothetical protein [Verrucomicrobium sp.]